MAEKWDLYTPLQRRLWSGGASRRGRLGRAAVRLGRLADSVARGFDDGRLSLRVKGLAYTTLLSLVPLLAVSFSVLKAFGVQQELEPLLLQFLEPLGERGLEIHQRILDFVNNLQVGVLGSVGLAMLFYTVISLVYNIEQTFNDIWHVSDGRSLARRFSDYLSVILIGPVLVFTAVSLVDTALASPFARHLAEVPLFGMVIWAVQRLVSYLLISCAFAFLYGFLPNTSVRVGPALVGGLLAGALWLTSGRVFASFVAASSQYSAIYSGFAGAVLFVFWVYLNWLIIVVGAQVCACLQQPRLLDPRRRESATAGSQAEQLALELMRLIGDAYQHGQPLWTLDRLQTQQPAYPAQMVARWMDALVAQRLIVANRDEPPAYLPGRSLTAIPLSEVLAVVRGRVGSGSGEPTVVQVAMAEIETAIARALEGRTVADLVGE
jgi:membrane protein